MRAGARVDEGVWVADRPPCVLADEADWGGDGRVHAGGRGEAGVGAAAGGGHIARVELGVRVGRADSGAARVFPGGQGLGHEARRAADVGGLAATQAHGADHGSGQRTEKVARTGS